MTTTTTTPKRPPKIGRTELLLPLELKERVRQHTARTGAPLSAVVRLALKAYLDQHAEKEAKEGELVATD